MNFSFLEISFEMESSKVLHHCGIYIDVDIYRKTSNIRLTESPNLYVSRLVLQLSLPNPFKPGVKLRTTI